jgi:hypothetical protein
MSFRVLVWFAALLTVGWPAGVSAQKKQQDPQEKFEPKSKPGAGQKYLEKFAGEWVVDKTFFPKSGQPARMKGECRQTMIQGGRFLQSEFTFHAKGGDTTGLGLIGFEPETGKFTSVWIDSRQTRMSLRQSEGRFDGEQIVLYGKTLDGEKSKKGRSRTVSRLEDGGRRLVHRQYNIAADGSDRVIMELALTRK